jgi:tetratricopeptide (TPR) repeat protein
MIRGHDEGGCKAQRFNPREMLQSMERLLSQAGSTGKTKADEAQQLVYDAWEAETAEREHELMCQALEADPANADALLYMLDGAGLGAEEEIQTLRDIVAAAEKGLGPKMFKEDAGAFWGFIKTRPYMRARHRLAVCLRAAGRLDEAMTEYEAMLALNPGDNQGVRYELLPAFLTLERLEPARALLTKYKEAEYNTATRHPRSKLWQRRESRTRTCRSVSRAIASCRASCRTATRRGARKRRSVLPRFCAQPGRNIPRP